MEYSDPMIELMNSLEVIVFKDKPQKITLPQKPKTLTEIEQLRKGTGLKIADFAKALGVTVSTVKEWESKRARPSATELKLMRLIHSNPMLSKELMD